MRTNTDVSKPTRAESGVAVLAPNQTIIKGMEINGAPNPTTVWESVAKKLIMAMFIFALYMFWRKG